MDEAHIEAYLRGRLSAAAQQEADARYARDPAFKAAVETMRLEMQLARLSHATHVAEQVSAARQRHEAAEPAQRRPRWYIWSAAAAAVLLLAFGLYAWLRPPTPQQLAEAYLEPPKYYGQSAGPVGMISKGMRLYLDSAYHEAIPYLKQAPTGTLAGDNDHFYLAACYLLEHDAGLARVQLEDLATRHPVTTELGQDIRWYLALALLSEGRKQEAVAYLDELLGQPSAVHGVSAKKLRAELD